MSGRRARRALAILGLAVAVALVAAFAMARPGGGGGFSGRSRPSGGGGYRGYSGGGGGGTDPFVLFDLVVLFVQYPWIGVPLVLVVGGFFVSSWLKEQDRQDWTSGTAAARAFEPPPRPRISARRRLERLRQRDESFSVILFEDFLYALFSATHVARGSGKLDELAPYLSEAVRAMLAAGPPLREVRGVVVGALRIADVER